VVNEWVGFIIKGLKDVQDLPLAFSLCCNGRLPTRNVLPFFEGIMLGQSLTIQTSSSFVVVVAMVVK